jgi:ABC-type multidrug transport system fused ATPase/permease subunit
MFFNAASFAGGAIILVSIILPRFLIAVGITFVFYAMTAAFYRASARETKVRPSKMLGFDVFTERCPQRLDAILQSSLYSHFSESLSGIATIRAYGEEVRFLKENRDRVDIENRAYWLTVANRVCILHSQICESLWLNLKVAMARFTSRFPGNPAGSFCGYSHRRHTVYCGSYADWLSPHVCSLHTAGTHQCLRHSDMYSPSSIITGVPLDCHAANGSREQHELR